MIERARRWLQARGLVGRKLHVLIGALVVLAVGLAALTMTGKSSKPPTKNSEASRLKTSPQNLGSLAQKAQGELGVDMGKLDEGLVQERFNQRVGQVEKDLREAREEQKIMKSALDQILDWQK